MVQSVFCTVESTLKNPTQTKCFRNYDAVYWNLTWSDYEGIVAKTKCQRPCIFNQFKFHGEPQQLSFQSENFIFSLWSSDSSVDVAKETYIYGLDSLVADFGGTLSLFLGVSFMTIWHVFISLLPKFGRFYVNCKRQISRLSVKKNIKNTEHRMY